MKRFIQRSTLLFVLAVPALAAEKTGRLAGTIVSRDASTNLDIAACSPDSDTSSMRIMPCLSEISPKASMKFSGTESITGFRQQQWGQQSCKVLACYRPRTAAVVPSAAR